ncbi:unnamed protein product, partial [Polarella glacialis]
MLRGAFSLVCLGLACGLSDDIASSELLCDAPPEGLSLLQSKARVVVRPASDGAAEEEAAMAAMISFARQSRNSSAGQGIPRAPISVNFPAATGVGVLEEQRQWLFNPRLEASSCWSTAPPAAFLGSVLASVATGVLPPSAVADASAPNSVNLVGLTAVGATLAAAASTSRRGQKVVEKSGRAAVVARRAETIAATAIANGNFTILVKALQKAGLVATVSGKSPYTVFAPIDAAFADLLKELGCSVEQLLANPNLDSILLYHVVGGSTMSSSLKDGQKVTTAQSGQLAVQVAGGKVKVGRATVTAADIEFSNGVIHVIDKVLRLPSSPSSRRRSPRRTSAPASPYTVFAPIDAAFADLLKELGCSVEQLLANPDLDSILLYHVVGGSTMSSSVKDGQKVTTAQSGQLAVQIAVKKVKVGRATVTAADIEFSNGMIHVIDKVLRLPSSPSSRRRSPRRTSAPASPYTVFAPIDAAFADLLKELGCSAEQLLANPDLKSILLYHVVGGSTMSSSLKDGQKSPYTVFAPIDAAFADLLKELGCSAEQLFANPDLKSILLYHVVGGSTMSSSLKDGQKVTTAQSGQLAVQIAGGKVKVGRATVTAAEIEWPNGVIHSIDKSKEDFGAGGYFSSLGSYIQNDGACYSSTYISAAAFGAGLTPARVLSKVMGSSGAFILLLQLFMAVTSTGSAEIIAVSSILTYDIYYTYVNPELKGRRDGFHPSKEDLGTGGYFSSLGSYIQNNGACYSSSTTALEKSCSFKKLAKDEWCRSSDVAVTGDGHHCRASTKDFIDVSETQHVESSECDFAAGERCVTSFLTIGSPSGLLFGITNIVGNFGTVFVDQSYWQSAVAANPKSAVKGFLIGGLVWFAVPFCMTTTTGLASRALTMHPELGPAYICSCLW